MPLYEYQCDACGHRFERIQKFSDPPVETCPTCGGQVQKLLSSPAIQFKGTGWYITDYARSGRTDSSAPHSSSSAGESGTAAESKSETKSDSKTDAAPATKSESKPTASSKSD
ncbi:MAG: FmdB family zinc ribbon protein [Vicinamibacterales bacterium]